MTTEEYIKNFTEEVMVDDFFDKNLQDTIVISIPNECYLTLKGANNQIMNDGLLDFLAEHDIIDLESNFPHPDNKRYPVANIGFSEKENKWYGWSHRAIYGFGIGSKVKKGDCAYVPYSKEDYIDDCIRFWTEDDHGDIHAENITDEGFDIKWIYSNKIQNETLRGMPGSIHEKFPKKYGRGEWKAKTLEDAKQMAIDFAHSVA